MEITFNERNAFDLLKRLSFPRLGGTAPEKQAAQLLKRHLGSLGITVREEPFPLLAYQAQSAGCEVLSPYRKNYPVSVLGNSGQTPPRGITAELSHVTTTAPEDLKTVRRKIVITYNAVTKVLYQQLRRRQVRALIRVGAVPELQHLKQNDLFTKAYGQIPSVLIGYEDGLEMVQRGARTVRVVCRQRAFKSRSQNIIAAIPGTELPNEKIIICAHYDSVDQSPGSIDNAGGSVTIAEFARHFAVHPAKRTLVFIWFGGEEMGLKGSWAYAQRHKSELARPKPPIFLETAQVKLVINVDVAGTAFGNNSAVICGTEGMAHFVEGLAKEKGLPLEARHSAYSSDNIPFNEAGIPSIALNRASGHYGHTPLDNMRLMSPGGLKLLGQFGLEMVARIADAVEIPFKLAIPEADKKFTREYVERANPYYQRP